MASRIKELSVWQLGRFLLASWARDVALWIGNWTGALFCKPRGCWVSVCWDVPSPKNLADVDRMESTCWAMRLLVENRSPFPVVVAEAGWLVRPPGRAAVEIPLLGASVGDFERYEIAAKSRAYLAVDICSSQDRMSPELEERLGWNDEEIDPRVDWGAYVRLDSGRVFRS